jgi:hypothetical protein
MRKVHDPTLFVSMYINLVRPAGLGKDARSDILKQLQSFAEKYGLKPAGSVFEYNWPGEVDLIPFDRSITSYKPLVNVRREEQRRAGGTRTLYECLVYAYHDALIVQIQIGKFSDWIGCLAEGWSELIGLIRAGCDESTIELAKNQAFGASAVYWMIANDNVDLASYADEVRDFANEERLNCTRTDLGMLWHSSSPVFVKAPSISQDRWILITPQSKDAEVNKRYNQLRRNGPTDFPNVALARHKFVFEWNHYCQEREALDHMERVLDRNSRRIIEAQQIDAARLGQLRSLESLNFQKKLTQAGITFADYNETISRVQELRRTLHINRKNYLINCMALISSQAEAQVARAQRQDEAAAEFLRNRQEEEIFGGVLGQMQGNCDQLDSDLAYSGALTQRHLTSLRSASEQLQVAGEQQLAEMGHHISIETAAVVATLGAFIVVELLKTHNVSAPLETNLVLFVSSFSFTLVQMLTGSGHAKTWLERVSFAIMFTFGIGSLLAWRTENGFGRFWWIYLVTLVSGFLLYWLWERLRFKFLRPRRQREAEIRQFLNEFLYSSDELDDLFEELPPKSKYLLSREAVLQRAQLNENPKRLHIKDIFGIRYVVTPWRMADVESRIRKVAGHSGNSDPKGPKPKRIEVEWWGRWTVDGVNLIAEVQISSALQKVVGKRA